MAAAAWGVLDAVATILVCGHPILWTAQDWAVNSKLASSPNSNQVMQIQLTHYLTPACLLSLTLT